MTRKHSKQSAAITKPQEGLKNPTAQVSITARAPDPDEIVELLTKDRARLQGFVKQSLKHNSRLREAAPLIQKGEKRAEVEKSTIAQANIDRASAAEADREKYREIALRLYKLKPELRSASREKLAREVQDLLKLRGTSKSIKTIRRALPPQK